MLHTITLLTPKRELGKSGLLQLTSQLIINKMVEIDYFGIELDNQADFIDDEMREKMESNTIINIHFEAEHVDYNSYSPGDILKLANELIDMGEILLEPEGNTRIEADNKDIDIYV